MYRAYVHELCRAILRGISGSNEKFFRVFITRSFYSLLSNLQSAACNSRSSMSVMIVVLYYRIL